MTGILWGLATAVGFGSADFVARNVSERLGAYRTLLYTHLVSFGLVLLIMRLTPQPDALPWGLLFVGAGLGALNTIATLLLYKALSIGTVSIVSPITSSFGGVTLALSLLSGDRVSGGRLISLVMMVIGVVLASTGPRREHHGHASRLRGVPSAIGAAISFGIFFWGLKYVVPTLGPWVPVAEGRLTTLILLPVLAPPLHQSIALPSPQTWWRISLIALLDTGANVAYNLGLASKDPRCKQRGF